MNEISNELATINVNEIQNKELKKITNRIFAIGDKMNSYKLELARLFVKVEMNNLFKQDGFKDMSAWAQACFGIKKTQSYELFKIGNSFVVEEVDDKGRVSYHSKFKTVSGDYSFTQLVRMYAFQSEHGKDKLLEYIENGDITINTSAAKIQQLSRDLKALKAPENKEEKQEAPENKEEKQEAPENKEEKQEEKHEDKQEEKQDENSNAIVGMLQSDARIVTLKYQGATYNIHLDTWESFLEAENIQ